MNKTIKLLTILCCLVAPLSVHSQVDSTHYIDSYNDFLERAVNGYDSFQKRAFNEFEQFLNSAWSEYQAFSSQQGIFPTKKPESMPSLPASSGVINVDAPFNSIEGRLIEKETNDRSDNKGTTPSDWVKINFYGRQLSFNVPLEMRVKSQGNKGLSHFTSRFVRFIGCSFLP